MRIYEALKQDHETVKALLNRLVSLNEDQNDEKSELLDQIRDELIPHARAEEAVFYNSLRLLDETKSIAMHGYREHLEAETLLRTLQAGDVINADWKSTAMKFKNALEHHIEDEEGEMFTAAQGLITDQEAEAINNAFQKMKPEVREEGFMMNTIEMVKNMMPPRLADALSEYHIPQGLKERTGSEKRPNR
ncbi:hemerythrin domain-containing protein [Bdellovibrio sp. HCB2-146]|uniref:hemerythrin domain-containing protein n=1 Tax=Bdellovibrio sp. HCB2-146 TaxID=3394362 RepID=UPI0039BC9B9D